MGKQKRDTLASILGDFFTFKGTNRKSGGDTYYGARSKDRPKNGGKGSSDKVHYDTGRGRTRYESGKK